MSDQQQPPDDAARLSPTLEAEIRQRVAYLGASFERFYLGSLLAALDATRAERLQLKEELVLRDMEHGQELQVAEARAAALISQHDGDRKMLRLAIDAQQRRAEQAEARAAALREALEGLAQIGMDCIKDGSSENRSRLIESVEWALGTLKDQVAAAPSAAPTAERGAVEDDPAVPPLRSTPVTLEISEVRRGTPSLEGEDA